MLPSDALTKEGKVLYPWLMGFGLVVSIIYLSFKLLKVKTSGKNIAINEGDLIRLKSSIYGNAYIGFEGIVKVYDHETFNIFSGSAWLTNLNLKDEEFEIIKRNETGLFSIKGVKYYSKSSVMHNPVRCCKCKFIPVEYTKTGLFKAYCNNCLK